MTSYDWALLRAKVSLHDTDVQASTLPICVQVCLSLGDKFAPPTPFVSRVFENDLQSFARKVRIRLHYFRNPDVEDANEDAADVGLPRFKLPSKWMPKLPVEDETALQSWLRSVRNYASKVARNSTVRLPYVLKKAVHWFRAQNKLGNICKISADKNYGPVAVRFPTIHDKLIAESRSGSFEQLTLDDVICRYMSAFDELDASLRFAVQGRFIDIKTKDFILQPFLELGFPQPTDAKLIVHSLGKIRYLIKLHKPGLGMRRVEADIRSPFANCTLFLTSILNTVSMWHKTCVRDALEVRWRLNDSGLDFSNGSLRFLTADVVDYFPSIKVDKLLVTLSTALTEYFGPNRPHLRDFVCKIAKLVLQNKILQFNGCYWKKKDSLSIGERIATDAANLHRHMTFRDLKTEFRQMFRLDFAYVDDTLSVIETTDDVLDAFLNRLQHTDDQFRWTTEVSNVSFNFLDVTGKISLGCRDLSFSTYVKPSYRAQYLHGLSSHPMRCKASIARSQLARFRCSNSTKEGFDADIRRMSSALAQRQLPPATEVDFRPDDFQSGIEKARARQLRLDASSDWIIPGKKVYRPVSEQRSHILVVAHNSVTRRIPFNRLWHGLTKSPSFSMFSSDRFMVAKRSDVNLFRLLYKCNFCT